MLENFLLILFIQALFFAVASWFKTDKVTDLSYGLTFILLAVFLYFKYEANFYLVAMPIIWGMRLATYLFIRILQTKTDKRFDGIREKFFAFAKFWLLQAVSIFVISLPFAVAAEKNIEMRTINYVALLLFAIGLSIETIADYQKYQFKSKYPKQLITSGIWRFSRHPNYFGEMLVWWSIYLFVLNSLGGWQHLAITGPLYISALLLFVTGVPTLEKQYAAKYGEIWTAYKKKTNLLLPWWR
jgi:steroid 5-alpha reductase family enzyme